MNNNFRQNPEYFFFKTKRESFRNQNLLNKLEVLNINLNEKEILEELNKINNNNKFECCDKIFSNYKSNLNNLTNHFSENYSFENENNFINKNYDDICEAENSKLSPLEKIKIILQGNVKEYIPKTFKIIVKENKND